MNTAASSGTQFQSQSGQTAVQAYAIPIDEANSIAKQIEAGTSSSTVHIGATAFLGIETSRRARARAAARAAAPGLRRLRRLRRRQRLRRLSGQRPAASAASGRPGQQRSRRDHRRRPVRLPGGQRRPDRGRHDHLGGRPVGLLGQRHQQILVKYHPGDKISISWVDQSGQSQTSDRDPGQRPRRLGRAGILQPAPLQHRHQLRASDPRPPPGITGFAVLSTSPGASPPEARSRRGNDKPPVRDKNDMTPARGGTGARGETPRGGRPAGGGRAGAGARGRG